LAAAKLFIKYIPTRVQAVLPPLELVARACISNALPLSKPPSPIGGIDADHSPF
jgi:hypothetical protein